MTNTDPNYPWLVLPETTADRLSEIVERMGVTEADPAAINELVDLIARHGRERFEKGARDGNHSTLGRNGIRFMKWCRQAVPQGVDAAPPWGDQGPRPRYWYANALLVAMCKVVRATDTSGELELPPVEDFLRDVQSRASEIGGAA